MSINNQNKFDWKSPLLGFFFSVSLAVMGYFYSQSLEKEKMVSEYLKILNDKNSPSYAQSVALVALYQLHGLPDELLFSLGYKIQDKTGEDVTKDLFYEYGHNAHLISCPIGFVDSYEYDEHNRNLTVAGWAIDCKTPPDKIDILVRLDGEIIPHDKPTPLERKDIQAIFRHYKLPIKAGFRLTLKVPQNKMNKKTRLRITLDNERYFFMDIMNTDVNLQKSFHSKECFPNKTT